MIREVIDRYPLPILDFGRPGVYIANLQFLYALMAAAEPLLELALARELRTDLRDYYARHLEEERGHADMVARDLASLACMPPVVDWCAAQVAGMQYYLVRHGPPEALLGYMAALESRPVSMDVVRNLETLYGEGAVRTLRHHAQHDIAHARELDEMIAAANHKDSIYTNARLTAAMIAEALGRID